MNGDALSWWCEHLPPEEARSLLIKAAEQHPHGFTDPRSIGCNWALTLQRMGFNALPPYSRNYLAMIYLKRTDPPLRERIPIH